MFADQQPPSLDDPYVDGVSVTHGHLGHTFGPLLLDQWRNFTVVVQDLTVLV